MNRNWILFRKTKNKSENTNVLVWWQWVQVCVWFVGFVHRQPTNIDRMGDDVGFHVPIYQHTCHELYWLNAYAHTHIQSQLHKYQAKLSHILHFDLLLLSLFLSPSLSRPFFQSQWKKTATKNTTAAISQTYTMILVCVCESLFIFNLLFRLHVLEALIFISTLSY